jgi:hypothetical protein
MLSAELNQEMKYWRESVGERSNNLNQIEYDWKTKEKKGDIYLFTGIQSGGCCQDTMVDRRGVFVFRQPRLGFRLPRRAALLYSSVFLPRSSFTWLALSLSHLMGHGPSLHPPPPPPGWKYSPAGCGRFGSPTRAFFPHVSRGMHTVQ